VRWRTVVAGVAVALVLASCAGSSTSGGLVPGPAGGSDSGEPADAFRATVVRVVDGDTFLARRDGRELRVRLIGVDAPESVKPDSPVECYGRAASRVLHDLLPEGAVVRGAYEQGGETDQFGRQLWDVWLPDGRFLQAVLVRRGAVEARLYRPQHEYADLLARLEGRARAERRGLWGSC
jgi:micrococcal nuclease